MKDDAKTDRLTWIRSVLERYEKPLVRYAARIMGDLERARDVAQDTFLRLCEENPESVADHLEAWLFKVCRNRALDLRRKEDRMRGFEEGEAEAVCGVGPAPGAALEVREESALALQALQTIPPRQREVIRLKFENGMSYRQISEVTGLSVDNVGFLIHTGLKQVRRELEALRQAAPASRRVQ